jgi:hypothetical protein
VLDRTEYKPRFVFQSLTLYHYLIVNIITLATTPHDVLPRQYCFKKSPSNTKNCLLDSRVAIAAVAPKTQFIIKLCYLTKNNLAISPIFIKIAPDFPLPLVF